MAGNSPLFLRPWEPGDEAAFTPRADFAAEMAAGGHDWSAGPPAGVVWTICRWHGEVVGVAGALETEDGPHGEAQPWFHLWAHLADLSPREIAMALRLARACIRRLTMMYPGRRFVAYARESLSGSVRCLQALGLKRHKLVAVDGLPHLYRQMVR